MNDGKLVIVILLPALFAAFTFVAPARVRLLREGLALLGVVLNTVACALLIGKQAVFFTPWCGFGINLSFKLYGLNSLILLAAAVFALLGVLYGAAFFQKKPVSGRFYAYLLITLSMVNGAVLANNLAVLLFFWEGILLTLFLMILLGREGAWHTAVKAVVLVGLSDLCMRVCPSSAIQIERVTEGVPEDQKVFQAYVQMERCIFCGQCVDSCPKKALENTDRFELASTDKRTLRVPI